MNDDFRRRIFTPFVLPLTAVGAILAIAFSLSRLLLAVPEIIATLVALVIAVYVLFVAAMVASKPKISSRALGVGLAIGMVGVLGAGVVSASAGIRDLDHEEEGEGAAEGEEAVPPSTWVAIDIEFEAAPTDVVSGEDITLINNGSIEHNVTIDGQALLDAPPGESVSAPLGLPPGTYTYFCDVPGHEQLMTGEVTVN